MSIKESLDCSVCETHVDCLSALHSHHIHIHSNSQLSLGLLNARGLSVNQNNKNHFAEYKTENEYPLDCTMQSRDNSKSDVVDKTSCQNVDTLYDKNLVKDSTKNTTTDGSVVQQICDCKATKLNKKSTNQPSVVLERFDVKSATSLPEANNASNNFISILKNNKANAQKVQHRLNQVQICNLTSSTMPIQQQELSSTSKTKTGVTHKRDLRRRSGINSFTDPFKVKCLQDFEYNISSIKTPPKRKTRITKPRKNKASPKDDILKNLLSTEEHCNEMKTPKVVKQRRKRNLFSKKDMNYATILDKNTENASKLQPLYIKTEIPQPTMLKSQVSNYQNPNMLLTIHNAAEMAASNYQKIPPQQLNYNYNNTDYNMNMSTDYLDMLGCSVNGDTNITINHQNNTAITIHDKSFYEVPQADPSCFDVNSYEFIPNPAGNNSLPNLVIKDNDLLPVEQTQRNPYWDNSMNIYLPSETDSSSEVESYSLVAENYPTGNYVMSTSGTTDCYSTWTENYNLNNYLPFPSTPYYESGNSFNLEYGSAYKYKLNCFKCRVDFRTESCLKQHMQYCQGSGASTHEDDAILDNHITNWLYQNQNKKKVVTQALTGKYKCLYCDIGFGSRTQYCKHLLMHKKVFDKYDLGFGITTQDIQTEITVKIEQDFE